MYDGALKEAKATGVALEVAVDFGDMANDELKEAAAPPPPCLDYYLTNLGGTCLGVYDMGCLCIFSDVVIYKL